MYNPSTHTNTRITLDLCDSIIARAHVREEIAEWIAQARRDATEEVTRVTRLHGGSK
jgi:hypothetical protein